MNRELLPPSIARLVWAQGLIPRLDACVSRFEPDSEIFQQITVYSGFLTDLTHGKVARGTDDNDALLKLVDEFCTLIETEAPVAH